MQFATYPNWWYEKGWAHTWIKVLDCLSNINIIFRDVKISPIPRPLQKVKEIYSRGQKCRWWTNSLQHIIVFLVSHEGTRQQGKFQPSLDKISIFRQNYTNGENISPTEYQAKCAFIFHSTGYRWGPYNNQVVEAPCEYKACNIVLHSIDFQHLHMLGSSIIPRGRFCSPTTYSWSCSIRENRPDL